MEKNKTKKTETEPVVKETKILKTNESLESQVKNLTLIVLIGFIVIALLQIGLYFRPASNASSTNTNDNTDTTATDNYNELAKNFTNVSIDEAVKLFDEKGTHVLYIGRSSCGVCQSIISSLVEVQNELNYKTYYYDLGVPMEENQIYSEEYQQMITNWPAIQKIIKPLTDLVTFETEANGVTDTCGKLFYDNGYTPTVIIIKDGKAVDGFIGGHSKDQITELVKKYI